MHLSTTPLLGLLLSGAALAVEPQTQTTVEIFIPPSTAVANPNTLPPSTHATLVSLGRTFRAPLSTTNAFVFHNVTAGSYLADVHCPTVAFAPMRIDVVVPELVVETDGKAAVPGSTAPTGKAGKGGLAPLEVHAWETYRGNDWDNKGEALVASDGRVQARALVAKAYFMERSGFSVFGILKNPMILIALVSMVLIFGLPYLIDNMDPEMKAEFEAQQKASPMNNLLRGASAGGGAPNPVSNFDMAAFLAGSNKKDSSDAQADTATATGSSPSGGNGGGKKNGRR